MGNLVEVVGKRDYDNLIYDINVPIITKAVKLKKGTKLVAGSVLGIATETGYAALVDSKKADGTQIADSILSADVDATAGDVTAVAYISGFFNTKALDFGEAGVEAHIVRLRELGIFVKESL